MRKMQIPRRTNNYYFIWEIVMYSKTICLIAIRSFKISSVQFSSVLQSCPTLCNPMDCSTPGLPVYHQLLEFIQTHVHWVSNAIQSSHPLSYLLLLPPSIFPSIRVFSNESALSIRWPKYWCFSISPSNDYWELISFRSPCCLRNFQEFSNTTVQKHQFFSPRPSL